MKNIHYDVDVCEWCLEELQAPHAETLAALNQAIQPADNFFFYFEWVYEPALKFPILRAALAALNELNNGLSDQARGPAVTIMLEFDGEKGSLTLCERHVRELLTGIRAIGQGQHT